MKRLLIALGCLTVPVSLFPFPGLSAQKRAITIDDYLALKSVGNPQLSPDGKWVAYTVTEQSLKDNRGIARTWLADVASGAVRQLTAGPGSDRQPRWSPDGRTLAFVSTRENGAQLWVLPIAGGEARRVTSLADGVFDPLWLPDGTGLIVTSDIKWPAQQEIDRRNDDFPTDARLWTGLLWRHWYDWRRERRRDLALDALRRVIHLLPRFEVRLWRGGGARPRQHLPDRPAIVPSFPRPWRWWGQHRRAGDARRSGAPVPAPEQHPAQRDLARRPPAHPSHRHGARGARSAAAGRVRFRGRAGRLRLRVAAQSPRFRPRQTVSAHLPDSRRAAGSVDRLLGSALELRAVRVARIRGGRGQLPRLDRLRPEVHGRHFPALGGLSVPGPDEGSRRAGSSSLCRFDADGGAGW